MKSSKALWIITALIMFCCTIYSAYALDYFSYRMNFPPGSSRYHTQEMTFTGSVTINLPNTFTFTGSTGSYTVSGSNYTWQNSSYTTINYTIQSPASCTEDTIYRSKIYSNGTLVDEFIYVCLPDKRVVDYKVEYGHGCGNYLAENEPYISNETAVLFNLIRVWNIGSFLDPDEDALNAQITCYFENYPVRTYGRVDVGYNPPVSGDFLWSIITGGYWFRIGVLSQEISGKSIGDLYDVNCTQVSYDFEHERVIASFPNYTLEVRTTDPLIMTSQPYNSKRIVTIINNEKYPIYGVVLDFTINGAIETNYVPRLGPNESITYYADNSTNISASFIPSWQRHCFNPVYYFQLLSNATNITGPPCPVASSIPSFAWAENTSNSNAFDLDDYFTDPNNATLAYNYTGTHIINVTINPATNEVSFSQPANFTGIEYAVFSAYNGNCTKYSNNVTLVVYPANITVQNVTVIQNVTQIITTGGGGGGGGGSKTCPQCPVCPTGYTPPEYCIPEEICQEIWLCTEWSECHPEGYRNRTCDDINNCGTEIFKPFTQQNCTTEQPIEEIPFSIVECKVCVIVPLLIFLLIMLLAFLVWSEQKEKGKQKQGIVSKWKKKAKSNAKKSAKK